MKELNKLWHSIMSNAKFSEIEERYSLLKQFSTSEISIIRIVSENDDVIIKDIIDALKVPKSTLTSIIDRLERKNIIVRDISVRDRRSYKLKLTKEGVKVQKEHEEFENQCLKKILISLDTNEEREQLLSLLGKINNSCKRTKDEDK
ncbi:Hypothetical protein CM240_3209 [Clostridium bornimense]|uniref:HTH marR-type domain-containing protein n=1 Tax=Clostridium bornimense TaxID=1216932 RepID=W6S091_9CLOT|nr:MarR family transcriptional regulator [Clostridium bornimense]CDM70326.1 Hypothetical protein CM240_3209 [Clostridium bornimense]